MKAVIYARTARERTPLRNSTRSQIAACRQYAKEREFDVFGVFADRGFSGATLNRPGLNRMRNLIASVPIGALLVSDPARLTRSLTNQVVLNLELAKQDTQIHCVENGARSRARTARPQKRAKGTHAK